jgi:hypothetical protein
MFYHFDKTSLQSNSYKTLIHKTLKQCLHSGTGIALPFPEIGKHPNKLNKSADP